MNIHPQPFAPRGPVSALPAPDAPPLVFIATLHDADSLAANLTDEENTRASRFLQPDDRLRFITGRGLARHLLGLRLHLPPRAIPLLATPAGKPFVALDHAPRFNVSHSGDLVLLALHPTCDVGVDVEQIRPARDLPALAARFLPAADAHAIAAAPEPDRAAHFFAAWTLWEARLKAAGTGLGSTPPPDLRTARVTVHAGYAAACAWRD